MSPEQTAKEVISKYGTRDPFKVAYCMDALVHTENLGVHLKGVFVRDCGHIYICLNQRLSTPEKRIVLAHELGHAVCHDDLELNYFFMVEHTLYPIGRYEREANEFAAELLIDDDEFMYFIRDGEEYAARALGVTREFIKIKKNIIKKHQKRRDF